MFIVVFVTVDREDKCEMVLVNVQWQIVCWKWENWLAGGLGLNAVALALRAVQQSFTISALKTWNVQSFISLLR